MEKKSPAAGRFESAQSRERLIYIGPNIPGGALQRYQVFRGGIPVHLGSAIEKCPAIRSLFVPVAQLAAAEQALSLAGTPEHTMFREVITSFAKGGK